MVSSYLRRSWLIPVGDDAVVHRNEELTV